MDADQILVHAGVRNAVRTEAVHSHRIRRGSADSHQEVRSARRHVDVLEAHVTGRFALEDRDYPRAVHQDHFGAVERRSRHVSLRANQVDGHVRPRSVFRRTPSSFHPTTLGACLLASRVHDRAPIGRARQVGRNRRGVPLDTQNWNTQCHTGGAEEQQCGLRDPPRPALDRHPHSERGGRPGSDREEGNVGLDRQLPRTTLSRDRDREVNRRVRHICHPQRHPLALAARAPR
jgi:hypothetical protein